MANRVLVKWAFPRHYKLEITITTILLLSFTILIMTVSTTHPSVDINSKFGPNKSSKAKRNRKLKLKSGKNPAPRSIGQSKMSQFVKQGGSVMLGNILPIQLVSDVDEYFDMDMIESSILEEYQFVTKQAGDLEDETWSRVDKVLGENDKNVANGILRGFVEEMMCYRSVAWYFFGEKASEDMIRDKKQNIDDATSYMKFIEDNVPHLRDKMKEFGLVINEMDLSDITDMIIDLATAGDILHTVLNDNNGFIIPKGAVEKQAGIWDWNPTLKIQCPDIDKLIGIAEPGMQTVMSELRETLSTIRTEPINIKHTMDNPLNNFSLWDYLNEHRVVIAIVILCYIGACAVYVGGVYETVFNVLAGIGVVFFFSDTWLLDWLKSLKEWVGEHVFGTSAIFKQGGIDFKGSLSTIAMTGLMGCMFSNLKSTTMTGLVEEFFVKNSHMRRVNDGMGFTIDYFLSMLQSAADWVSEIGNLKKIKIIDDPFWEVGLYGASVSEKRKEYLQDPLRDSTFAGELTQIRAEGEALRSKICKMPNNNHQMSTLSMHLKEINELISDLTAKLITVNSTRPEPFMLLLTGKAGITKSSFINSLWPEITAETLPTEKLTHFTDHQGEYIHSFNQNDQFYSGYNGQLNFMIDEFGLLKDIPGGASMFSDFIQWVNVNPMNLNMADLASKGHVYFRSKHIWATSNRRHFRDIDSVVDKQAVYRRLANTYVAAVRCEYSTEETRSLGAWEREVDFTLVERDEIDDFSYLEFHKMTNVENGTYDNVAISVQELKEMTLGKIASSNAMHTFLTQRTKKRVDDVIARRIQKQEGVFCGRCPSCSNKVYHRKNQGLEAWLREIQVFPEGIRWKKIGYDMVALDELVNQIYFFEAAPFTVHGQTFTDCVENAKNLDEAAHTIAYHSERNRVTREITFGESTYGKVLYYAKVLALGLASTFMVTKGIKWLFNSIFGVDEPIMQGDYPLHQKQPKARLSNRNKINRIKAQGGDDPNAQNIIVKLVNRNVWRFSVPLGEHKSYQGCVLVLQNNLVIMPEHYIGRWMDIVNGDIDNNVAPDPDVTITFTSCMMRNAQTGEKKPHQFTKTLKDLLTTTNEEGQATADFMKVTDNMEDDVGIMFIPGITGRKISHLFRSKEQRIPTNHKGTLGLVNRDFAQVYHTSGYKLRENIVYSDGTWGCSKAIVYDIATKTGDCGSPFIIHDKSTEAKIASIHVGGIGNQQGIGIIIDREGIEVGISVMCQMYNIVKDLMAETAHPDVAPLVKENYVVTQGGPVFDAKAKPIPQASKTKLIHSPIFNEIEGAPSFKKPAMLRRTDGIDPMVNAMWGYGIRNIRPRDDIYRAAVDDYSNLLFSCNYEITAEFARTLSFEEAVAGIPGEDFIDAINRKTSPGWPMKHLLTKGSKKAAFGDQEFTFDNDQAIMVRDHVDWLEKTILDGNRPYVVNNHFLKDELRTIEKSDLGKTRLISSADLVFSICLRKHTLMFSAFVMRTRIDNGVCIGVNPYSDEWTYLANYHGGNKPNYRVIAGDHTGYDKCLAPQDIWVLKPLMERFYNDKGENSWVIRNGLIDEMAQSRHLVTDLVYQWMGSNTSGNALTGVANSISGNVLTRYNIGLKEEKRLKSYFEARTFFKTLNNYVKISQNGDDVIISIQTNGPFNYITQEYLTHGFADIGMTFTDELKGVTTDQDRRLDQITFLKRHFKQSHYLDKRKWMAALSLETILESVQWTKDHDVDYTFWKDNLHRMQMELAAHENDVYEMWSGRLHKALCRDNKHRNLMDTSTRRDLQDKFTSTELVF